MGQTASSLPDVAQQRNRSAVERDGQRSHRRRKPHPRGETQTVLNPSFHGPRDRFQEPNWQRDHVPKRATTSTASESRDLDQLEPDTWNSAWERKRRTSRGNKKGDDASYNKPGKPKVPQETTRALSRNIRSSRSDRQHSEVQSENRRSKVKFESRVDIIEPQDAGSKDLQDRSLDRHPKREYKECIVCTETRSSRHFSRYTPTSQCSHEVNTCRRCLRTWIESEFSSKMWNQLKCPECKAQMQHADVKYSAPSHIFRTYERLSARAAMEAIPGFRWCISKGCRSGQIHDGLSTPRFRCIACKASHCIVHEVKWHKGETCAEYDYRTDQSLKKAENEASKKFVRQIAKKCPGCKWNIEKNDGCDHMTCSRCRHQFCWLCLAPYNLIVKHGNRMHGRDCEYFIDEAPRVL